MPVTSMITHPVRLADVGATDVGDHVEPLRERVDDRLFDELLGERQLELLTRQRGTSCAGGAYTSPHATALAARTARRREAVLRPRHRGGPGARSGRDLTRRDPALLPRPPRRLDAPWRPRPLHARLPAARAGREPGVALRDRHRDPPRGPDRAGLLHRPRHGRGDRRDHRDRRGRHDLPGRHPRRHGQGRGQAPPDRARRRHRRHRRPRARPGRARGVLQGGRRRHRHQGRAPQLHRRRQPRPAGRGRRPARARATSTTRTSTTCTCRTPSPRR